MTSTCKLDKTKKYRQGNQISQFNNFISILISLLIERFLVLGYFPPFWVSNLIGCFLIMVPESQKLGCDLCDMMMAMVLFRRWKVLICGNPSADFLIIYQNCQSHLLRTWFLSQNWKVHIMVHHELKILHSQEMNLSQSR